MQVVFVNMTHINLMPDSTLERCLLMRWANNGKVKRAGFGKACGREGASSLMLEFSLDPPEAPPAPPAPPPPPPTKHPSQAMALCCSCGQVFPARLGHVCTVNHDLTASPICGGTL